MDAVELIAEAIDKLDYRPPEGWRAGAGDSPAERLLIGALECFYGHGAADEQAGETDTTGHVFRVAHWTLETDAAGFVDVTEHPTTAGAEKFVAAIAEGEAIARDMGDA